MEKTDAVGVVVRVLKTVQELSGHQAVEISDSTCPIGDLIQFDSLCGVEASVLISTELGFELPGVNAFVNEQGTKALTVGEIADVICAAALPVSA
jgi:acyl carrier protein